MDHTGALDPEDELGPLAHLAPSPQSEAVAHEFQELSLQSSQYLPPLNERKNDRVGKAQIEWSFIKEGKGKVDEDNIPEKATAPLQEFTPR
ncbi:hypothetical protein MDA_GLEAN10012895 [Myotis davidii]|uniref:Uncharacterized protein n=1 Tax=Myotis davidii TaxID=225400 RepID=L5M3P0_MYODS|nr:hypothetical protein MDA_GLEAN10012895 [Myotis davidii]